MASYYLFTHAPVGLETVRGLAILFGVEYKDKTMDELGDTIDRINEKFKNTSPEECARALILFENDEMIDRLDWRRGTDKEDATTPKLDLPPLPEEGRNYGVVDIHGHEGVLTEYTIS